MQLTAHDLCIKYQNIETYSQLVVNMKLILATLAIASFAKGAEDVADLAHVITLGTRPYYLLDEMESSELKEKLGESSCADAVTETLHT